MSIINKILPVIMIFVLGYFLKKIKLLKKEDGDLFLKVVFYVSLPALIINSVAGIPLNFQFAYLPLVAALIIFTIFGIALLIGKLLVLPGKTMGTFLVGTMIINTAFNLPFILAAYGEEGIAILSMFDLGNACIALSFGYYIACRYGETPCTSKVIFRKFLLFPPIWGLAIGVFLSSTQIQAPRSITGFFGLLGGLTVPLIMLTLGIYFQFQISNPKIVAVGLLLRFGFGFALAFIIVKILQLDGMIEKIVLLEGLAPVGYNTLVFSSQEKLNVKYATELVSLSILIGLVLIPVMIFVFG